MECSFHDMGSFLSFHILPWYVPRIWNDIRKWTKGSRKKSVGVGRRSILSCLFGVFGRPPFLRVDGPLRWLKTRGHGDVPPVEMVVVLQASQGSNIPKNMPWIQQPLVFGWERNPEKTTVRSVEEGVLFFFGLWKLGKSQPWCWEFREIEEQQIGHDITFFYEGNPIEILKQLDYGTWIPPPPPKVHMEPKEWWFPKVMDPIPFIKVPFQVKHVNEFRGVNLPLFTGFQ